MKFSVTAAAMAALGGIASAAKDERTFAVLRFTNKFLTKGSVDPLVTPGKVSSHAHQVMGGSGFGLGSTGDDLMKSTCTNANVKGDLSNYWFPKLYFHDEAKNDFEEVEVMYVNVYYFFDATNDDIKAFPKGLGIFSGDPMTRVAPQVGAKVNLNPLDGPVNAVSWVCPRSNGTDASWPPNSDGKTFGMESNVRGEGVGFPDKNCDGLYSPLRMDVHFPSCYNPDKGLLDYKNNMAWPEQKNGKWDCPKGWIHVPHLFLEVYWETNEFADRWTQGQGKQPFVLSNGDVTGYSSHADFMAAWDEDILQNIIDNCNAGTSGMDNCPGVQRNTEDCTIPNPAGNEEVTGTMSKLPGANPLSGFSYGAASGMPSGGGSNSGSNNGGSNSGGSDQGSPDKELPVETPKAPEKEEGALPEKPIDIPTVTVEYGAPQPTVKTPEEEKEALPKKPIAISTITVEYGATQPTVVTPEEEEEALPNKHIAISTVTVEYGAAQPTVVTPEEEKEALPKKPIAISTVTVEYGATQPTVQPPVGPVANIGLEKPQKTKPCKDSKSKKARKTRQAKRAASPAAKQERDVPSWGGSHAARASGVASKARRHAQVHQQAARRHSHGHSY
ncbi:hypothetical protein NLU13_3090 [Sarocladium strictum]|uniref:DUF1996 domain-containing protein n=1 Tax=Sarocladium strictum TaxID=5046 RepID=A0AA39GLC5_SARSR|nr:hypothetical protein NLU13_3090 [Sarocladium strictum]